MVQPTGNPQIRFEGTDMPPSPSGGLSIITGLTGAAYENGYRTLTSRSTAMIGISVGNPYFKEEVIRALVPTCAALFGKVKIFITDVPGRHTYEAEGNSPEKAMAKARSKGNALRNKCSRVCSGLSSSNIELVDWNSEVAGDERYKASLAKITSLYTKNPDFSSAVNKAVQEVIHDQIKPGLKLEERVPIAAKYLLEEFAFLEAAPALKIKLAISCVRRRTQVMSSSFTRFKVQR